jgi:hypothetical protein
MLLTLVLVFFNARGITNKEVVLKEFLHKKEAVFCGVSESHSYRDSVALSDARWRWDIGPEGKPSERGTRPARGIGAMIDIQKTKANVVAEGKYTLWHRIDLLSPNEGDGGEGVTRTPLVVGTGYFPKALDKAGHKEANDELFRFLSKFRLEGYKVIFGGDLNAHTGSNGCPMDVDEAGMMLLETAELTDMVVINTIPGLTKGGPSRVQVRVEDTQESTVDYVMCSSDLLPLVKSLVIDEDQMGSDHRPMVLTLGGVEPVRPMEGGLREVWKIENIPNTDENWGWVNSCHDRFRSWIGHGVPMLDAVKSAGIDSQCVGDVLDWSFQCALDGVAAEVLGTEWRGPKATPTVSAAMRLAQQHKEVCGDIMKTLAADPEADESARKQARAQFLAASRAVTSAAARKREITELALFRQVEERQRDSKLFWGKFKVLRNSINVCKSPPPVAINEEGKTVTDPSEVLRAWRDFSARIASPDLTGTEEEGIYDEDYRREVEDRHAALRMVRLHQEELDGPITRKEVWEAIRKLKMGKAPGEDGVISDILRSGADAVGTSKMRGNTGVVEALVLMFNYVFDNEVWPERWGSGVVMPIHKHDSRLLPSNYRPITLMSIVGKLFGTVVNARLHQYSERMGTISDEQGGFRTNRGTTDQTFILREILASRKERGFATYATFIDARKAYDTVWREYAYSNIHDSGVQGKLWRQLQVMHGGLRRRVRHPLGLTDVYHVGRGVAQGAVESPWVYSNFIEGLARALKRAGVGVMVADRRVPLLMYADDIVMLASSVTELERMNTIVTEFARKHRFQFNGEKSAVMIFGGSPSERTRVDSTNWELFGEKVKVKPGYEYLGTYTPNDGVSWRDSLKGAIAKAKRRSADLLWVCRSDRGMRPRTAVTLWQSLVRPLLEYACELWSGQVPEYLIQEAEQVQMIFLRGILGLHANGSGVADDTIRAETGSERLQDRWAKLKMGFWRKIFTAEEGRLLRTVAEFRHKECLASHDNAAGYGTKGWMPAARTTLLKYGFAAEWAQPERTAVYGVAEWKGRVYDAVDAHTDAARHNRMLTLPTAAEYAHVKAWGPTPTDYAFSSGEKSRLGQHTPERYLDDRRRLKATRLKLLCRLGCLPVMDRVGREQSPKWPKHHRVCIACRNAEVEDVQHFMMVCPAYSRHRANMMTRVGGALRRAKVPLTMSGMNNTDRCRVLLGKRIGDPIVEDQIDGYIKQFLTKAWNTRSTTTAAINTVLGTKYGVRVGMPEAV